MNYEENDVVLADNERVWVRQGNVLEDDDLK